MATCAVSGTITDPAGNAITSVTVSARLLSPVVSGSSVLAPETQSTTTNSSGNFTLTLTQSISVVWTVSYPVVDTEPMRRLYYTGNIPASTMASLS